MKKIILLIIVVLTTFNVYSQTLGNSVINDFDKLVEDHKYLSAYNLLHENENNIDNSIYVIKAINLFLDYFVMSTMHQMFALKDIPENENIYNYRGKEGSYEFIMFDPVVILEEAIEEDKDNGELYYWLGNYYYEVLSKYNGQWLISNEEIREKSIQNYKFAYSKNYSNASLFGNTGQLLLQNGNYSEAVDFLNKAIQAEPGNAAYYHNAAVCHLNLNNHEQAIEQVQNAIRLYNNDYWKADSCFLLGSIYVQIENYDLAIENFETGKLLAPDEYKYPDRLIELYLFSNDLKNAEENALYFFDMYPTSPKVLSMILDHYNYYNQINSVDSIFVNLIGKYQNNYESLGNLYFYRSIISDAKGEFEKSLEYVENARNFLFKVFENNHEVFTELNKIEEQVKNKMQ